MATSIIIENTFEIPLGLRSLDEFRRWTHSAEFPERGRIDYAEERIEVDTSPEDLFTHGAPKGDIYAARSLSSGSIVAANQVASPQRKTQTVSSDRACFHVTSRLTAAVTRMGSGNTIC